MRLLKKHLRCTLPPLFTFGSYFIWFVVTLSFKANLPNKIQNETKRLQRKLKPFKRFKPQPAQNVVAFLCSPLD